MKVFFRSKYSLLGINDFRILSFIFLACGSLLAIIDFASLLIVAMCGDDSSGYGDCIYGPR